MGTARTPKAVDLDRLTAAVGPRGGRRNEAEDDMSARPSARLAGVVLGLALAAAAAPGYIHFPPMTLQKMCKTSTHIRVLKVKKHDKEKGVIVFEVVENLKGKNPRITSFRHAVRADAGGVKPVLDWVGNGKRAVMFSVEADPRGTPMACGYVFIDDYCYSVDYNRGGEYWLLVRAEPHMSACYHGSAEQLQRLARDILDDKDVKVPVKEPASPVSREDREKRIKEVSDVLIKNRR